MSQPFRNRRNFLLTLGAGLGGSALLAACARTARSSAATSYLVYVGTYGPPDQENIVLYRLTPATGALTRVTGAKGGVAPSFLTVDKDRRTLYAVNEIDNFQNTPNGGVSAFAIDPRTGGLTLLGQQASGGTIPCYISLDKQGRHALVANYGNGTVAALPLGEGGTLRAASSVDQHQGLGPHKNQANARAHCILPDPGGQHLFAVDLGNDTVYGYTLDAAGQLQALAEPAFRAKPGAGPRILTFHPSKPWAYLINELDSTMTALAYDPGRGTFREIQTLTTLPAGFTEWNACAHVHVSPNGRFLYGSNRGHNSLVVYAIDPSSGRLALVEHVMLPGKTPRSFTFDPSGRVVLVAHQQSDTIVTYFADARTGRLRPTGASVALPAPVCLQVYPDFLRD
ncbi:6-phosphogluconolactonase [Hymenobacter luteus]|uniref:6-phosphogluconolactonase n=2 Tax=Hymenobacter TaxID=89966 RepID=A0A7W9SYL4_9BACT|nr:MULTISPECIES: lactonase family protein [Hymenobacter]MBB4601491.1 6-phosphogluconolactonase [Hymenobacter latericoloratus]MBB6058302.1 6-phosphogluconolactonase [Hymenobacter luteus]